MNEYDCSVFRKFVNTKDAINLLNFLTQNGIEVRVKDNSPQVDISFSAYNTNLVEINKLL